MTGKGMPQHMRQLAGRQINASTAQRRTKGTMAARKRIRSQKTGNHMININRNRNMAISTVFCINERKTAVLAIRQG
ncbi:hypothetical protein AYM39_21420 [Methylomonas sp. DH-1]|nr:hypothetical protein AYM39_21420 [Methylomonas sp. DH-1]